MPEIKAEIQNNRLSIFWTNSKDIDMTKYVEGIEEACSQLASDFVCLIFISKYKKLNQWEKSMLHNTERLLYAYGLSCVIYIDKKANNLNFSNGNSTQLKYAVKNARDIQDAERIIQGINCIN
jgi:hypothetical protein